MLNHHKIPVNCAKKLYKPCINIAKAIGKNQIFFFFQEKIKNEPKTAQKA
jgi:hypothetical protein